MAIITLGNFDGVHLGHQTLIRKAKEVSGLDGVVAVTFDSHPAQVTRLQSPDPLMGLDRRIALLEAAGASRVEVLPTSRDLLGLGPEEFVMWLRERVAFTGIVEGRDFRFGRGRSGDNTTLAKLGARLGFSLVVVDDVDVAMHDGQLVCVRSSTIRWLLRMGRVADAGLLLGRNHAVCGRVVKGAQRGRKLGYPTANLGDTDAMLPMDGVYAVDVRLDGGESLRGAASVGTNPTFGNSPRTLEVHVLGIPESQDLYGKAIEVSFREWVRPMMRFDAVEQLIEQMGRDCRQVMA